MSTSGMNLTDMGIGTLANSDDAAPPPTDGLTSEQREALMLSELAGMVDNEEGVGEIESASEVQADPGRRTVQPPVAGEGENTNDAVPPAGEDLSDTDTPPDDLPFNLPPTGSDQIASPGDDGGGEGGTVTADNPTQPPTIDFNQIVKQVYGDDVTEDEVRALLQMRADMAKLPPDRVAALQQVLAGQPVYQQQPYQQPTPYQPTPYQQPVQPIQPVVPQQPIPQPVAPYTPPDYSAIPDSLDPDVAASLAPITTELQQMRAYIAQQQQEAMRTAQERQQREYQVAYAAAEEAGAKWRAEKESAQLLTPEEYLALEYQAGQSGLLATFHQSLGDPAKAVQATLDHLYYTNPEFRQREIQLEAAKARQEAAEQARRTSASTALSGGGGAKPLANGTPRRPGQSNQSSTDSLVDAVSQLLSGGQP